MTDVGTHYRRSRERLTELLGGVSADDWRTPVPACPDWTVHDVLGHLVGVVEDAMAGRITGPPPPEMTAEEVERHRADDPTELLAQWDRIAGPFEEIITGLQAWPAALDVGSHEQDVRGALGHPGARDDELITQGARLLVEGLDVGATIAVDFGDEVVHTARHPGSEYTVRTTPFEVFRFRLGRRSRDQVAALDWTPDPGDLVDQLFFFGPAEAPVVE